MHIGLMLMTMTLFAFAGRLDDDVPRVETAGPWQVRVTAGTIFIGGQKVKIEREWLLDIAPAELVNVTNEKYASLPEFNAQAAGWGRGARIAGLITGETTAPDMLIPESFVLKAAPGDSPPLKPGVDYKLEARWATSGRVPGGAIAAGAPVYADYRFGRGRLNSIVVDRNGNVTLLRGTPDNATPHPPTTPDDQAAIANVWVPGRLTALTADCFYPIVEPRYPSVKRRGKPVAATLLPKTWAKLEAGEHVNILAWGDSVTEGGNASDAAHTYQRKFVDLLVKRFGSSSIELTTVAWGGRNSDSFLKEPPKSPHNFNEQVIARRPDLIVMEFVNDAYLTPEQVEERYSALLKRFNEIGAEWIILTPHYVRPDWMGAASTRVETDPRPYVAGIRAFGQRHKVAIADASLRWGHLLKEGIPYVTLLSNCINHPDDRGHELFAQALIALFE